MYTYPESYAGSALDQPDSVHGGLQVGTVYSPRPAVWPGVVPIGGGRRAFSNPQVVPNRGPEPEEQPLPGFGGLSIYNLFQWEDALYQGGDSGLWFSVQGPTRSPWENVPRENPNESGLVNPSWWDKIRPRNKRAGAAAGQTDVDAGNGIDVSQAGNTFTVSVEEGDGLEFDGTALEVKAGDGIQVDENGVHVDYGDGLAISAGALVVAPGDGLEISGGNVAVDLASNSGLQFDGGDLAALPDGNRGMAKDGSGLYVQVFTGDILTPDYWLDFNGSGELVHVGPCSTDGCATIPSGCCVHVAWDATGHITCVTAY